MDDLEYVENDNQFLSYQEDYLSDVSNVKESLEALDRLTTSYEVLNDYVSKTDSVSLEANIQPMLQLALAGTGIEVKDISTESAIDVIKTIGRTLISMIKRIYNTILDAISNFDLQATWLLRNVTLLERKRATSRGKLPSENKVTIGRQSIHLRVGRIYADDSTTLDRELKRMLDVVKVISDDLTSGLVKSANFITSRTAGKSGSELSKALLDGIDEVGFSRISTRLKMGSTPKGRWNRDGVKETPPLLGGKSIFLFDGNLGERGLVGLRVHGLEYKSTAVTPYEVEVEREFRTLTTSDLNGIPEILREILMTLSKRSSGVVLSNMKKMRDGLSSYLNTVSNDKSLDEEDMKNIRRSISALTHWSSNVLSPLYGNSMQICRTVITYGLNSTKTYK